jgi:transcription initiation factor IIE alpha subunit
LNRGFIIVEPVISDKMIETETASAAAPALPRELQSPRAKLVYLYLTTNGDATVSEMGESLGMKKLSLYSILKTLRSEGLVDCDGDRYVPN